MNNKLFDVLVEFLRKSWFPLFTLLITLGALIVSILDRGTNEEHYEQSTKLLIEHDKLFLAPLIDFRLEELYNNVVLYIKNVGEGPATILSLDFYYQGKHFPGMREFTLYLKQRGDYLNQDNDTTRYGGSWITADDLNLAKDEKQPLMTIDRASFEQELRLFRIFDSTGTKITYLDLYNDTLLRLYHPSIIEEAIGSQ